MAASEDWDAQTNATDDDQKEVTYVNTVLFLAFLGSHAFVDNMYHWMHGHWAPFDKLHVEIQYECPAELKSILILSNADIIPNNHR